MTQEKDIGQMVDPSVDLAPIRILFLEDNPDDVELMQAELDMAGFRFLSMQTERKSDFIKCVREFCPDVVLADYSLTSFNGVQAFHMLRKEEINIPFILVTGVLSEQLALECLKEGIDDFVLKASFRRLPQAITAAMQKKATEYERTRMAAELEKSHGELRLLINRQQTSIEEERMNIARDLHDELGQVLTALKIDIMMLRKRFSHGKLHSEREIDEEFKTVIDMVDKITGSVKEISAGLRPETLDELGLIEAIQWQAIEFERRSKIKCEAVLPSESPTLSKEMSITLFRIVQESLTNAARHSGASQVHIQFEIRGKSLSLEVRDNGKGIEREQVNSSQSLGIIGLRERVHQLSGKFQIGPSAEGGTRVSVVVPILTKTK